MLLCNKIICGVHIKPSNNIHVFGIHNQNSCPNIGISGKRQPKFVNLNRFQFFLFWYFKHSGLREELI